MLTDRALTMCAMPALLKIIGYVVVVFVISGCHGLTDSVPSTHSEILQLKAVYRLGQAYANSSINVPVFREQTIVKLSNGEMVVAYFDLAGEVRLDVLTKSGTLRRTTWVRPRLEDRLLADGHCAISLGYAPDGSVHIIYGAHGTDPFYAYVPEHQLIDAPINEHLRARRWGRTITYPQFYTVGNSFQMWFRADPSSEIHRTFYQPNNSLLPLDSETVLSPGDARSVYMNQLAVSRNRIALTWLYRLDSTEGVVRNEGLYAMLSEDGGTTWHTTHTRQTIKLPVKRHKLVPFVRVGDIRQPLNQTSSRFGPDGRLYVTWYAKDEVGHHQIFLGILNTSGELISTQAVSNSKKNYALLGRGTLVLPLSRPQIVISKRFVHVIYRQEDQLIIASQKTAESNNEWSYMRLVSGNLGAWEPNISAEYWQQEERLLVYVQAARQNRDDTANVGRSEQASVYEFNEYKVIQQ